MRRVTWEWSGGAENTRVENAIESGQVGMKKQRWTTREWTTWHEDVGVENAGADKSARRSRDGQRGSGQRGTRM